MTYLLNKLLTIFVASAVLGASGMHISKDELNKELLRAATLCNLPALQNCLALGADIQARTVCNQTALMCISFYGNKEIAEFLINAGIDIDAQDNMKHTALILAARDGGYEVAECLVNAGADIHKRDQYDETALQWAAYNGHKKIVELLVGAGAQVNTRDSCKRAPLQKAAEHGHKEVTEYLIKNGAQINAQDENGNTALMYAINHRDRLDILALLIQSGADLDLKNKKGFTALTFAVGRDTTSSAELLINRMLRIPNEIQKKNVYTLLKCLEKCNISRDIRNYCILLLRNAIEEENRECFEKSVAYQELQKISDDMSMKHELLKKYCPQLDKK